MVRISLALCGVLHVSQNTGGHSAMVWIFWFIYMFIFFVYYKYGTMGDGGWVGVLLNLITQFLCICIQKENQNVVHVYI